MSFQSIKLITFDATNTLLKFKIPPWQYYALIAKDYGFHGTEEDIKLKMASNYKVMWDKHPNYGCASIKWQNWWSEVVKMTLKDHLPVTADLDSIAFKLINEFKTSRTYCINNGGEKLLNELKKRKILIGVISNFDPRLYDILQDVGLLKKFDFVVTSYEVGFSKPDEKIFECAIKKCQQDLEPSEALHVGDDVKKDYEGALAAGWHAVLINPSLNCEKQPPARHVFNSLEDLCVSIELNKLSL